MNIAEALALYNYIKPPKPVKEQQNIHEKRNTVDEELTKIVVEELLRPTIVEYIRNGEDVKKTLEIVIQQLPSSYRKLARPHVRI